MNPPAHDIWLLARLVAALLFISVVETIGAVQSQPAYSARLWQASDGLPNDWVNSICQTQDGYLWVGTQEGLARFDGLGFTIFDSSNTPALTTATITTLAAGKDNSLWIGTKNGVVHYQDGRFTRFPTGEGWAGQVVRALHCAPDGTVWIGTLSGISRLAGGRIEPLHQGNSTPRMEVKAICGGTDGQIYFGTRDELKAFRGGILENFRAEAAPLTEVRAMHLSRAGKLWIGTHRRLVQLFPENPASLQAQAGLTHTIVTALHEDRLGNLWIGTYGGLNRLSASDGSLVEIKNEGDSFDLINAIYEDREGNIWVGLRDGLVRLRFKSFSTYTKKEGLNYNNVVSVLEDQTGTLWVGTWGGGLNRFANGRFSVFHQPGSEIMILGLCQDRTGALWFSRDLPGLLMRAEGTNLAIFGQAQGFNNAGRVIRQTRSGDYWIGGRNGLSHFDGETFTLFTTQDGLAGNDIRDICEDRDGRLWIATGNGLSVRREDRFVSFTPKDGQPASTVYCIYEDHAGTLWLGTKNGLFTYSGDQFGAITSEQGLPSDTVFAIVEDDDGQFWMSSPAGIFQASKKELKAAAGNPDARVACTAYDEQDGLATTHCSYVAQPSAWKTRDGRIWFATTKGLSAIHPAQAPTVRSLPPPVVIERVIANRQPVTTFNRYTVKSAGEHPVSTKQPFNDLTIQPGKGELEFHFTALSFRAPEKTRFNYKLDGVDSDWVDAGTSRVAYYPNVAPGHYRFLVVARSNDGARNETGASLALIIKPHFWQTPWFGALMVLATMGLAASVARHFTWKTAQRKLSRLEQQHAIDRERARIAQDMHDDLGTRLTEIMLTSHRAKNSKDGDSERKRHLNRITEVSRELVDNLDAIVWAVNPRNDSLDKLVLYISEFAGPFLEAASIRYRLIAPNPMPECALSSEARHNLFLVVKEALNNAAKHSGATEIRIVVGVNDQTLSLSIEDNGTGFTEASHQSGNGLANMKKRVETVGGVFHLQSRPAQGTRIQLSLPLSK